MKLVLVMPTYNEAENLPLMAHAIFAQALDDVHILVVDDNSPDGTGDVAEALAAAYTGRLHVIHRATKEGLGRAYIQGFQAALAMGAEAIGMMDSDFSHPPEKLPEMVAALQTADVAVGSRYIPGGSVDREWHIFRKALSAFGNFYARTILNLPIKDATGGFRLWRRSALQSIPYEDARSNGYIFTVELAYLATLKGLRFKEVPIYFAERQRGESKMNLRISLEASYRVWQVRRIYRHLRRQMKK